MDTKCPHCGLPLTMSRDTSGRPHLRYDLDDWKRRCKRLDLASPALCFIEPASRVPADKPDAQNGAGDPPRRTEALGPVS